MPYHKIDIREFLERSVDTPIADVRSPGEYNHGHIPGAINIPLFDDKEREIVGTVYTRKGRNESLLEGLKLAGSGLYEKLGMAVNISGDKKLLVHCWRGGMRSEAMAWLFSLAGIETYILDGGDKSYRGYILGKLSEKRKMIILGGMTGSGKTRILENLKRKELQTIDLEFLAKHKGSAFGSLGQPEQPTAEQFSNELYAEWRKLDETQVVWIEDESINIGTVFMPEQFFRNMQDSPAIILKMDIKTRLPRLIEEYSVFDPEMLKASIMKISRRLGGDMAREAIEAIDNNNIMKAIELSLHYYDRAYMHSIKRKTTAQIIHIETETDDVEGNAMLVMEAAKKFQL